MINLAEFDLARMNMDERQRAAARARVIRLARRAKRK
jgi:hypothetical protein